MAKTYIHWVVALRPEAEPVIRRFNLKPVANSTSNTGFPVWEGAHAEEGGIIHRLTLSGIGKINAAAATAWLQATSLEISDGGVQPAVAWINFGISGHRTRELGEVVRASRITDSGTERSWYPPAVWKRKIDFDSSPLRSVDAPCSNYPAADCMVDMEASGFVTVASRFSSLELVQCVKVISDNSDHAIESITKESVREMCQVALEKVTLWLDAYGEIAREETVRLQSPPLYEAVTARVRFSETQKHQLRRILIRHHALGSGLKETDLSHLKTGREVIATLNSMTTE